jgi:hypothetical protein
MRGVGWIVVLLGLLGVTYLVTRALGSVRGERAGNAVLEPIQRAGESVEAVSRTPGSHDREAQGSGALVPQNHKSVWLSFWSSFRRRPESSPKVWTRLSPG